MQVINANKRPQETSILINLQFVFQIGSNQLSQVHVDSKQTPNCCHQSFHGCHGHILPHSTIFINCTSSHNLNIFTILIHLRMLHFYYVYFCFTCLINPFKKILRTNLYPSCINIWTCFHHVLMYVYQSNGGWWFW